MIFAQIKDGKVENVFELDNLNLLDYFKLGFDHVERVDDKNPRPGIGWTFENGAFANPYNAG